PGTGLKLFCGRTRFFYRLFLTFFLQYMAQAQNSNIAKRKSFQSIKHQVDYPDFLEVQLKSFKDFFQLETTPENRVKEGLYAVFNENFPITDARNQFVLEFLDYYID